MAGLPGGEAIERRIQAIPFLRLLGVRVVSADAESLALELPAAPELQNHVGTVHAAAQFALGESAVGALTLVAFADLVDAAAAPVVATASVTYRRPARGPLRARALLPHGEQRRIRAEFAATGRARYELPVDLTDQTGAVTTTMQVAMVLLIPREDLQQL